MGDEYGGRRDARGPSPDDDRTCHCVAIRNLQRVAVPPCLSWKKASSL
jgi:hypothetical protein